jgi:phosphatidylglycerophosphatase A
MLLTPSVFIGSLALAGFAPRARGTAGTLVCVPFAVALLYAPSQPWLAIALVAAAASLVSGVFVLRKLQNLKDPGWFVMDEAAGFFMTLALIGADSPLDIFAGLLTFRLYDIAKPWPVRSFERLPGSMGILLDDLVAAVLAAWTWQTALLLVSQLK